MQNQERDNLLPQVQLKTVHRITRKASTPQPRLFGLEPGDQGLGDEARPRSCRKGKNKQGRSGNFSSLFLFVYSLLCHQALSCIFERAFKRRKKHFMFYSSFCQNHLEGQFLHTFSRKNLICVTLAIFWL